MNQLTETKSTHNEYSVNNDSSILISDDAVIDMFKKFAKSNLKNPCLPDFIDEMVAEKLPVTTIMNQAMTSELLFLELQ